MELKVKTKQNQVLCRKQSRAPLVFNKEPKKKNEDMFLEYGALIGYIIYIIGLFLPYYKSIDTFQLGIDVLFLGDLYLWMLIFAAIVCIVGIARKKDYFRWIIPNSIFCIIEIFIRLIYFYTRLTFQSMMLLGIGFYLINTGAVIIWVITASYWGGKSLEKRLKEENDRLNAATPKSLRKRGNR